MRVGLVLALMLSSAQPQTPPLEAQLKAESPAALAQAFREQGDPRRGADVFFQPQLACAKCHDHVGNSTPLGPDLAKLGRDVTDAYLIESVLDPSRSIKTGYETATVSTRDGRLMTGILAETQPDRVVLRDPAQDGKLVTIPRKEIEALTTNAPSLMPPGLVNQLSKRQEFLDLLRYLREIADHGPDRARALRPIGALATSSPVPAYEREIDHAGLIAGLGQESYRRGEAIYDRVCINCHGTKDRPGSLPNSLRFASGTFKNGHDPYAMYRTLTHGFGQMPPQSWMVPAQKYDVIHYIREAFLKQSNPSQYFRVDRNYLSGLPKGKSRGPDPIESEPWRETDYGPSLMATLEVGDDGSNFAYKGIAVRLDPGVGGIARGRTWAVYDHDTLRLAAAWEGTGFIDWNSIGFNGRHEVHPRIVGRVHATTPAGPSWADPETGSFDDPRLRGRDGRPYGPLPRRWARYRGLYHHADRVVLSYSVGQADVLDSSDVERVPAHPDRPVFTRTIEVGRSSRDLRFRVAGRGTAVALVGGNRAWLASNDDVTLLHIPSGATPLVFKLLLSSGPPDELASYAKQSPAPVSLRPWTSGGPRHWHERLATRVVAGRADGPFAVDVLTHPAVNPWRCRMRLTGFDFLPGGRSAAVCDWDGDVWLVEGLTDPNGILAWRRIGSGLFQPLGLKVVDGQIFVACRDQIVILRDLNGDGETDFYECFNDDHQVTEHFHEFAMDLQTDADGNFYYAKAARHGKTALVPQHGTLLRVSKDGTRTDILATGFRAPNGVCVNGDGTFFLTDQEGFWLPKNRINWVKEGGFYGNMWGYHDVTDPSDAAMEPPLCWITNAFDRSPAQMLWVDSPAWGPLRGSLLSLSYGYGKIFVVPHERVGDRMQGGLCALPIPPFPTGIMRGRFHPEDGHLYTCGMFAWAGNQEQPGGFYRVRYTGKAVFSPVELHAKKTGMEITFTGVLDRACATDPSRYAVKTWSLKRTARYGSEHYDEKPSLVAGARLSEDGRTVFLEIPGIRPTWCMEIVYSLKGGDGVAVNGVIHNTIHELTD